MENSKKLDTYINEMSLMLSYVYGVLPVSQRLSMTLTSEESSIVNMRDESYINQHDLRLLSIIKDIEDEQFRPQDANIALDHIIQNCPEYYRIYQEHGILDYTPTAMYRPNIRRFEALSILKALRDDLIKIDDIILYVDSGHKDSVMDNIVTLLDHEGVINIIFHDYFESMPGFNKKVIVLDRYPFMEIFNKSNSVAFQAEKQEAIKKLIKEATLNDSLSSIGLDGLI